MATVLVLDDREADRELMAMLVKHAGHRVVEAARAADALDAARAERPDLIVTDIVMPGTNGYEFVRSLREEREVGDTPVIFCTANYVEEEVARLAAACGVTRFIEKPYQPADVLKAVSAVLGGPQEWSAPALPPPDEFDREQARVLNNKLVQKLDELEAANHSRKRLLAQLMQAQEDERTRIADNIHDDSIQAVYAVALRLELLGQRLEADEDREILERSQSTVSTAIGRLRNLLFELRPPELESQGVAAATEAYLATVRSDEQLDCAVDGDLPPSASLEAKTMLYRSVQEALMNVRKHAKASQIHVALGERDGGYFAATRDNGCGFGPEEALRVRAGHLGLPAMRERVESVGGTLRIDSVPGAGSTVEVWLPANAAL